jgi:2,4-dienoyl-CoA reductase-like NADH-dependent reductase (Old Yellow Enzyme family)/thioredoxin reductase
MGVTTSVINDPIALGPTTLRNRIFVAPHTTNFGEPGVNLITDRHLDYHRERARGGAGLIITEGIRVHPTSLRRLGLHAFDDRAMPGLTALADTVHAEGTALFAQLLHTGRHSGDEHYGAWGASAAPWSTGATVPHVMNAFDIDTVIEGFAAAARRVVDAGFDGMEVHLGHGHLLQQFLSPITNTRTDGYGGSPRARLRLAAEALTAVIEAVDGRAAVGVRLSADEFLPGGLTPDDVVQAVEWLLEDSAIDFLHVSHSAYVGAPSLSTQMADMSYGRAPFRHLPARFKQEFPGIPVLAICRIDSLETGAEMLDAGEADLVGFARAHIAEPALTSKSLAGASPRSCIACNQGCNANLEAVTPITCTVNPAVGMEGAWAHAESSTPQPQRVLVVGAGPAGLEAATTAARRGHDVTLVDSRDTIGGSLNDVVRMRGRDGFATLSTELGLELAASAVSVHLGETVTAQTAEGFDVVVLATGARQKRVRAISLGGEIPVLDIVTAVRNPDLAGRHCVILDDLGTWEASGLAQQLAEDGVTVELVSSGPGFAPKVTVYSRLALGERLGSRGVRVHALQRPIRVMGSDLILAHSVGGAESTIRSVDAIIHVRPPVASTELFDELQDSGWHGRVYLVGDAFAPRTAQEAVYEGRATGLVIGVDDLGVSAGISARSPYRFPRKATT